MKPYRRDLKVIARSLRRNMTDAEHELWRRLRNKQLSGAQFYRQKPLLDYIVDFYCPRAMLVIEIDGAQHLEVINKVLRFNNFQVLKEMETVLAVIETAIVSAEDLKV